MNEYDVADMQCDYASMYEEPTNDILKMCKHFLCYIIYKESRRLIAITLAAFDVTNYYLCGK